MGSVGAGSETQAVKHVRAGAPPMLLMQGEGDTLVKPRNTRALAAALKQAGSAVETRFHAGFDHNAPLISLASPWRGSRDIDEAILAFARRVTDLSFPVQAERP